MALLPGSRVGSYEVLELVGAGGMGDVYKSRDVRLRRTVALKTLGAQLEGSPQARARFRREARAVAALNHPNICDIHDVGEWEGQDFLVMEFVEGETLQHRLSRGPLPVDDLLHIGMQIASALVAAHRAGIVHRDLKPANVMLARGNVVKLLDFGVARHALSPESAPDATLTATSLDVGGELAGTLPYMAPEQLEGRPVDARTDIFAFGAVLFEMASGRRAFDGASSAAVIAAILGDARPRLSTAGAKVPRAVERLASACLARNPDDRWQTSADLLRELTWVRDDLEREDDPVARSRQPRRRMVHTLWAIGVVAAFALSWFAASRAGRDAVAPNPTPVVVLMDSPLPGRVYDERTAAAGGTNADDVTDAIRDLPVVIQKENTSAAWHREEQVLAQHPDLVVAHLSCLFDARVAADRPSVYDQLFAQAENRLLLFFAYAAARNPRTHFIVYSRTVFQEAGGERPWVAQVEARLPVLRGRVQAFIVPGGREKATFRDPGTARLLRARIVAVLGLPGEDGGG